jgi:gamma-glutamylcyclotransferase
VSVYFAYGSNLHPDRLGERLGRVECLGVGRLVDWRLTFEKEGCDGSGKCDVVPDADGFSVWGALYKLSLEQFTVLDEFEGRGYERRRITVEGEAGAVSTETYVAVPALRKSGLWPFDWYRDLVLAGALHHGFEAGYCEAIEQTVAVPDPDAVRGLRWTRFARKLLAGVRRGRR